MNKIYKILIIITLIPSLLSGMESHNSKEKSLFEKLPNEIRTEILEHRIREIVAHHVDSTKDLSKLNELMIKAFKSQDECNLLPRLALTNKAFFGTSHFLVSKILKEEMSKLHKMASVVLNFSKKKGLLVHIGEPCQDSYISYKLDYNLKFPHIFPGIASGRSGHLKDTSDWYLVGRTIDYILKFLMTSYCQDKDPATLNLIKFISDRGIYIDKENFQEIHDLAVKCKSSQLIELLEANKEKILAQESTEIFSITDLLNGINL